MFGITPRLNIETVSEDLFYCPFESFRVIKAWLDGYISVTEAKDRAGDRAYREQCLEWATRLSAKMIGLDGQSFSKLSAEQQAAVKEFYDLTEQFLSSENGPKKPRSRINKAVQEFFFSLRAIDKIEEYESIYFLEDLEALSLALQCQLFFGDDAELALVLKKETEELKLPLATLREAEILKRYRLMDSCLLPLARIALQISPQRFSRLGQLHLTIPAQIRVFENGVVFAKLFELFSALKSDIDAPNDAAPFQHIKEMFVSWQREKVDITHFFCGKFYKAEGLLSIIQEAFTDTITARVERLANDFDADLGEDFIQGFCQLTGEYQLNSQDKKEFIFAMYDSVVIECLLGSKVGQRIVLLNIDALRSLDTRVVKLMRGVAFTKEELVTLCQEKPLEKEGNQVLFHDLHLMFHEIFAQRNCQLFANFMLEDDGSLSLCCQYLSRLEIHVLFEKLIVPAFELDPMFYQNNDGLLEKLCRLSNAYKVQFPSLRDKRDQADIQMVDFVALSLRVH